MPVEAADGAQYFRFHARGSYGRAFGGVIGISAGVESHVVTLREMGVVPGDDFADELRQLVRERSGDLPEDSGWSISVVPKEWDPFVLCAARRAAIQASG